jgi:hypothetical protein
MRTKSIIALCALALGVVGAAPASAQEPRACIHAQLNCSDAPYPVTQPAARRPSRPLYNMVPPQVVHRDTQQQNAMAPCIHVQTYCM